MSVDMEGSTRFKQTVANRQPQRWLETVLAFVEQFPQTFRAARESHRQNQERANPLPEPRLWKMLGDELLFVAEPDRLRGLTDLVESFHSALVGFNRLANERTDDYLKVKGTAWVAGFPVTNAVVLLGRTEGEQEDYIGPSMDGGFRVAKLSSSRRLALSVDLAWLLSHPESGSQHRLHFEGCAELKGMSEEVGYPALWIETPKSQYKVKEDAMLGRNPQGGKENVHALCTAFIQEYGVPNHHPFLPGDNSIASPTDYEIRYKNTVEGLHKVYLVDDPDAEATLSAKNAEEASERLLTQLPDSDTTPPAADAV